jgi:WD40 repeat protein
MLTPRRSQSVNFRVSQMNNNITLSAIATLTEYMFLGGTNGEIFIAKLIALSFDKNESADNIQKNRMCQARSYQAHVTFVNQIELDCTSNRLFTTGINDQCVFQWNISGSEDYWELDFNEYDMSVKDVFLAEVDPKEKYHSMIDELLTLRDEIVHMQEKIDETIQPEIFLELDKVIGRKAYNRRNNLLFTKDNNLVFNAGSMIVLLNIPPVKTDVPLTQKSLDEYFSQKFLEPDKGNIFSISPEISAIAICPNGKFLCTGTTQNNARILIWEMTSRTFIRSMTLSNCCTVLALEYAEDSRTIICVALSKNYTQCLYLIDTEKSKILASVNHLYSIPFKIKDMIFRPGSTTEFITCGVQHMTLWSYKGDLLNFKEFSIKMTNMKARVPDLEKSENEQTQQQNTVLKVTFLAIISVFDFIITGADDGRVESG